MAVTFRLARNPDPDSTLPYLLRIPVPGEALVLRAKQPWPRTARVYCHGDLFDVTHIQAGFLAEQLAHLQVRYPTVTVLFAGSRRFAEEWTFWWLGAAARELGVDRTGETGDEVERGDIVTLYEGGRWKNRAHGNRRATSVHDSQDEAIEKGVRLARERGVGHHVT